MRGATLGALASKSKVAISIHAPLAGRDLEAPPVARGGSISIHAPLAGRDLVLNADVLGIAISIHAPLAGRDLDVFFR